MSRPRGLCWCGCGHATPLATRNDPNRGDLKGQPVRYILGHVGKRPLERAPYKSVAHNGKGIREHRVILETAFGRPLPPRAEGHHVNGNGRDNKRGNLVLCEDHSYHMLLE